MHPRTAILLLVVLTALTAVYLLTEAPERRPADSEQAESTEKELPTPDALVSTQRLRQDLPDETRNDADSGSPPSEPSGDPNAGKRLERGAAVQVYDGATGRPAYGFRYVIEFNDGDHIDATTDKNFVTVPLDDRRTAQIRIELEGYEPQTTELAVSRGERVRRVRIDLMPTLANTGIRLRLIQPDGQPVPQARVVVYRRPLGAAGSARTVLWERQTVRANGVYPLPELEPGDYMFEVFALSSQRGEPLPLQPQRHEVIWTGSGLVDDTVQFVAGCRMRLDVRTPAGAHENGIPLQVTDASGKRFDTVWVATVDGEPVRTENGVASPGVAELVSPLPPGRYTVRARLGGHEPAQATALLQVFAPPPTVVLSVGGR